MLTLPVDTISRCKQSTETVHSSIHENYYKNYEHDLYQYSSNLQSKQEIILTLYKNKIYCFIQLFFLIVKIYSSSSSSNDCNSCISNNSETIKTTATCLNLPKWWHH